jgi:hydrogenase maturation protease
MEKKSIAASIKKSKISLQNSIAVLGLGNILLRDEGVGVRIAEHLLNNYIFSPVVKVIDAGTLGFGLISEIQDIQKLIVVDAVKAGKTPGTIYKFTQNDIDTTIPQLLSAHDVGFLEVIEQWKLMGVLPEVIFLGIEPYDMSSWGMELSDCISNKMPRLVELVLDELKKDGVTITEKSTR